MTDQTISTIKPATTFAKRFLASLSLIVAVVSLGLFSTPASAQDFSSLFEKIDPSVVTITTQELVGSKRGTQQRGGIGAGVIIDKEGLIMTAAHVVHTADKIQVKFVSGETVPAQVISSVRGADLALLKVESIPSSASVATMGDSDAVKIGSVSLVIGAPLGVEHSLSIGHVSGKATRPTIAGGSPLRLIQTDAAVNHGNSGGPLFNDKGEVVGIVSHILTQGGGSDGIGFAIAMAEAKTILLEGTPFWSGFEGQVLPPPIAKMFNVAQKSGLLVERVLTGSLADKAGLKGGSAKVEILGQSLWVGGDIILEIQDTTCESPHDVCTVRETIDSFKSGDKVTMKILRGGAILDLVVQL